jgi:GT2 family glycosyltransferase
MSMKISYAIPVHNEYEEIDRLLEHLLKHKNEVDEIIVQCDQGNTVPNVYKVLDKYKG